jgi:hypothetical protein
MVLFETALLESGFELDDNRWAVGWAGLHSLQWHSVITALPQPGANLHSMIPGWLVGTLGFVLGTSPPHTKYVCARCTGVRG